MSNPQSVLEFINTVLSKCSACMAAYIECKPEWWFEKQRICHDFSPEKIYDYEHLLDGDILKEYKAFQLQDSMYTGFKTVAFLIICKIRSSRMWSKINCKSINLTEKEISFLFCDKIDYGMEWVMAVDLLVPKIPQEYRNRFADVLFKLYITDLEQCSEISDLRIAIVKCLDNLYSNECNQVLQKYESIRVYRSENTEIAKRIYLDLINNGQVVLILNSQFIRVFGTLDVNEVFSKITLFDKQTFGLLIENIDCVTVTSQMICGILRYLALNSFILQLKLDPGTETVFIKIVQCIIAQDDGLPTKTFELLEEIDFGKLGPFGYWFLYISLFYGITLRGVAILTDMSRLLQQLIDKKLYNPKVHTQDIIKRFVKDLRVVASAKDGRDSTVIQISRMLKFNYENACMFLTAFKPLPLLVKNVIDNLIFVGSAGITELLDIVNKTSPSLVQSIIQKAIANSKNQDTMCLIKSWMVEHQNNSVNKMSDIASPRKMLKVVIKKKPDVKTPASVDPAINKACTDMNKLSKTAKPSLNLLQLKQRVANIFQNNADKEAIIIEKINEKPIRNKIESVSSEDVNNNSQRNLDLNIIELPNTDLIRNQQNDIGIDSDRLNNIHSTAIVNKSSSLFLREKQPKSTASSGDISDPFFKYVLSPFDPLLPIPTKILPQTFESYDEYFAIFNPLQINETMYAIRTVMNERQNTHTCRIHTFSKTLKLQIVGFQYEMHDLLYFSEKKEEIFKKDMSGFFGLVINIIPEVFAIGSRPIDLVEVMISSDFQQLPSWKMDPGSTMAYRYCTNIMTYYRECIALRSIKASSLLKYILRPSFASEFYKGDTVWDQKHLCYTTTNSRLNYIPLSSVKDPSSTLLETYLTTDCKLNASQAFSVSKTCYSRENLSLIQGPPGTGKTTTIISLIMVFLMAGCSTFSDIRDISFIKTRTTLSSLKILVCAPSNTAVDVVVARLADGLLAPSGMRIPVKFVRIGICSTPVASKYTVDHLINTSVKPQTKHGLLSEASVVCATLSSSASDLLVHCNFDVVIVDEACQATELTTLLVLKFNPSKIVLIGDPCQLPPTVFSPKSDLYTSLFERLTKYQTPIMLTEQYRMHPSICSLSSDLFYEGNLKTAEITMDKRLHGFEHKFQPLCFIDTSRCHESVTRTKSYANAGECKACRQICETLEEKYGETLKIIILTPYKSQVDMLKMGGWHQSLGVDINTIDGFQGQECDVVILSTVRKKRLGFTADPRRINVAITRTRKCLIVLGDKKCLSTSSIWVEIVRRMERYGRFTVERIHEFLSTL